jgi:hypothetical protein
MGLDVYLYRCKNIKAAEEYEKRQNTAHDAFWEKSPDEASSLCDKWDEENPPDNNAKEESIELNSVLHPDHMFRVGYFRSSYNGGGINNVLKMTVGKNLYDIFFPDGEQTQYKFVPDWNRALKIAVDLRERYSTFRSKNGRIRIIRVSHNPFMSPEEHPKGAKGAMDTFVVQQDRHNERFKNGGTDPFSTKDDHNTQIEMVISSLAMESTSWQPSLELMIGVAMVDPWLRF